MWRVYGRVTWIYSCADLGKFQAIIRQLNWPLAATDNRLDQQRRRFLARLVNIVCLKCVMFGQYHHDGLLLEIRMSGLVNK